jgi:hypothetical protein
MHGRLGGYLRQHHLALLCLFLILSGGTAYALDGSNTVFTDDIVDKQVKTADIDAAAVTNGKLAPDSVNSARIASGGVTTADIADAAVALSKLGPNAVNSAKVVDNALKGADIDESTLNLNLAQNPVPAVRAISPDAPETNTGQCLHFGVDVLNGSGAALIPFADEEYDIGGTDADGLHTSDPDCSAATARLTAPVDGIYLITGEVRWSGEDNNCSNCEYGMRELRIRGNGFSTLARDALPTTTVAGGTNIENFPTSQTVTTVERLATNDYVELLAQHNHSSSLLQRIDIHESHFTMTWLGPFS